MPDAPTGTMEVDGRIIDLDATSEMFAKKLLYRADSFKARYLFDMVVVLVLARPSAMAALKATGRTRPALHRRLSEMDAVQEIILARDLLVTDGWQPHATGMVTKLRDAIAEIDG